MAGWKDKFGSWVDKWTAPIDGIEGPDRGDPRFKKGDIVVSTRDPSRKGRVYRAIEWGDKWKYGVEWEDGDVDKATDMIKPLGESVDHERLDDMEADMYRALTQVVRTMGMQLPGSQWAWDPEIVQGVRDVMVGMGYSESDLDLILDRPGTLGESVILVTVGDIREAVRRVMRERSL